MKRVCNCIHTCTKRSKTLPDNTEVDQVKYKCSIKLLTVPDDNLERVSRLELNNTGRRLIWQGNVYPATVDLSKSLEGQDCLTFESAVADLYSVVDDLGIIIQLAITSQN